VLPPWAGAHVVEARRLERLPPHEGFIKSKGGAGVGVRGRGGGGKRGQALPLIAGRRTRRQPDARHLGVVVAVACDVLAPCTAHDTAAVAADPTFQDRTHCAAMRPDAVQIKRSRHCNEPGMTGASLFAPGMNGEPRQRAQLRGFRATFPVLSQCAAMRSVSRFELLIGLYILRQPGCPPRGLHCAQLEAGEDCCFC